MDRSYTCPHCGTKTGFAIFPVAEALDPNISIDTILDPSTGIDKTRLRVTGHPSNPGGSAYIQYHQLRFVSRCFSCGKHCYWEGGELAFPRRTGILPSPDMPDNAKEVFEEAQTIIGLSPRAACALLRVCLERIVDWYGENEKVTGFDKSDKLYKKIQTIGISPAFQLICKACRLAGNEHAHSGEIDLTGEDSYEIAEAMSRMINSLVNTWITPLRESEEVLQRLGKS